LKGEEGGGGITIGLDGADMPPLARLRRNGDSG
jgi:hypothetical protein